MRTRNHTESTKHHSVWSLVLVLGGILLVATPLFAFEDYIPQASADPACSLCHTCAFPTHGDNCLSKEFCLRHNIRHGESGLPSEKVMVLDELENVYHPVYFSHEKHALMADMGGGCTECHHFAPSSSSHPACKECHPPEGIKSKIDPSLKAAYHRQCLNCHKEWDTETHCEWCHRKKEGGMTDAQIKALPDLIHQAPLKVKDLITFETDFDDNDKVPFHHTNHVELYNRDCSVCHKNETCASCHVHGAESHPLGLIEDVDLHDTCYQCHSDADEDCVLCHGRDSNDLFDHAETGWALQAYHKVLQCSACHKDHGKYHANDPRCETCHFSGFDENHFNHGVTGVVLDQVHMEDADCADCHTAGYGHHTTCDNCHDDDRSWKRSPSFGPDVD